MASPGHLPLQAVAPARSIVAAVVAADDLLSHRAVASLNHVDDAVAGNAGLYNVVIW
jgi:hypothetical protein